MNRNFRIGALLAGAGVVVVAAVVAMNAPAEAPGTFEGAPPAPLSYDDGSFLDGWDVQVHSRDAQHHPGEMEAVVAQHGSDCSAPPATHLTDGTTSSLVFQCSNHFMTSLVDGGYGVIYVTPPQMVAFPGTVSFDISTEEFNIREWWDITVSPFNDSQALPLLCNLCGQTDLQGPNRNSILISQANGNSAPTLQVVRNGAVTGYDPLDWNATPGSGVVAGTNQAATRQPFRLTLSATNVRFERLASATAPALVYIDQTIPALSWSQGVVQFGHHSYNGDKASPNQETYHWDNIAISPSVPFYIGAVQPKFTSGGNVTGQPAPANAYLRFSAICKAKVDGAIATKMVYGGHPETFASYMVPIAQGSTSWAISFADDSWYTTNNGCLAKDFHVWSLGTSGSTPTPTNTVALSPTSTSTPTVTSTPTATSTTAPTSTPVPPTATATATPTNTPTATSTPTSTPTPQTYRCQRRNANGTYTTLWTHGAGSCP